jgi:hypothetical protein
MKLVTSQTDFDCGLAVIEMLTNKKQNPSSKNGIGISRGMKVKEMRRALGTKVLDVKFPNKMLALVDLPLTPCALLLKAPFSIGHWIAWDGKNIFDSEGEVKEQFDYSRCFDNVYCIIPLPLAAICQAVQEEPLCPEVQATEGQGVDS